MSLGTKLQIEEKVSPKKYLRDTILREEKRGSAINGLGLLIRDFGAGGIERERQNIVVDMILKVVKMPKCIIKFG